MVLILLGGPHLTAARAEPHSPTITLVVTKTADTNDGVCDADCSLREAILAANALRGADAVIVPAGVYTLTIPGIGEDFGATGDLDITGDLTLTGAGAEATVIDGGRIDRVIEVTKTVNVMLGDVTITGGYSADYYNPAAGIANSGSLTLTNSSILSNTRTGLVNTFGTLTILSNTISGNTQNGIASRGGMTTILDSFVANNLLGGIDTRNYDSEPTSCTLNVVNSVISGNGTYSFTTGGIQSTGCVVNITATTISGNYSLEGAGILGGDYSYGGVVTVSSSIISNNMAACCGGGIAQYNGELNVLNTMIAQNTAVYGGGGINTVYSSVTIQNSTFQENKVLSGSPYVQGGGGLQVRGGVDVLVIDNSTFLGNVVIGGDGGALLIDIGVIATINNSTLSGNSTDHNGGGLYTKGQAIVNLNNVTITNNRSDSDDDATGDGGGIFIYMIDKNSPVLTSNTLLAGNTDAGSQAPDCFGTLISLGYNLIHNTTGCVISGTLTGVITGTDPLLGPLQDNGGNTLTHALLPGSPAIDAGNLLGCLDAFGLPLLTDQRGYARHVDGGNGTARCDLGAYEYNALPVTVTPTSTPTSSPTPTPTPSPTRTPTHTPSPTSTPTGGQSYWLYLPILYHSP